MTCNILNRTLGNGDDKLCCIQKVTSTFPDYLLADKKMGLSGTIPAVKCSRVLLLPQMQVNYDQTGRPLQNSLLCKPGKLNFPYLCMTVPVLRESQISLPIDNQSDILHRPNTSNLRKESKFSTQNFIYLF